MKILILYSDINLRSILLNWIEQNTRHIATAEDFDDVALSVACFEPDIVLLPRYSEDQVLFPNVSFCQLPEDFETDIGSDQPLPQLFKHAERIQRLLRISAHGYAGDTQRVISPIELPHRTSMGIFADRRKIDENKRAEEAAKLLHLLQIASRENRHEKARRYLSTLRRFDRGLELEMAHDVANSSFRLAELRDQTARWLSVFAHYLEGFELEYCAKPQYASAQVAYVHSAMPPSHFYALSSVFRAGVSPGMIKQILDALCFDYGQTGDELSQTEFGCRLLGLNCYLRHAATAHVKIMEELLYSDTALDPMEPLPRMMDRQLGLFCEFWGFSELGSSRQELRSVMDSYQAGTVRVTHAMPALSFKEFLAEL